MIGSLLVLFCRMARRTPLHMRYFALLAVGARFLALYIPVSGSSALAQAPPKQPVVKSSANPAGNGGGQKLTVTVPANVQAFFVTDVYAKDSGFVSRINFDIGAHVKKGEVLAVILNPELQAQLDKAQAAIQQAKASLEVAKRQLVGMQAEQVLKRVTLKRQEELFVGSAATPQALDEAKARAGVADANAETWKAKIALSEADIKAAKAEAQRLQALLEYDKIRAPFHGVVTRRLVNLGDLVQAATATRTAPLFTVQKIDVVRVFADVPEASAWWVRPGLRAEVRLYSPAGVIFRGKVSRIATSLDPATRTMRTEIDLPNPKRILQPGMYAQVTLGPRR